jgi:predicted permease
LWKTPETVVTHPWFIATLFDTYFGFLTFYAWLAYKETKWFARVAWLIAILLLGNIAMSFYMLLTLFRLPANATIEQVLLRQKK